MRYYPRLDKIQHDIVDELRCREYSVLSLASIGGGAPDIAVGFIVGGRPRCVFFELKTPKKATKPETKEKQAAFRKRWKGPLYTCSSLVQVLAALEDAGR